MKIHYNTLVECEKTRRQKGGSATSGAVYTNCPDKDGWDGGGYLFVRGKAGAGLGVSISVTYALDFETPISSDNISFDAQAGYVGFGASIEAGGGAQLGYVTQWN